MGGNKRALALCPPKAMALKVITPAARLIYPATLTRRESEMERAPQPLKGLLYHLERK
jgi:hypothetical protein